MLVYDIYLRIHLKQSASIIIMDSEKLEAIRTVDEKKKEDAIKESKKKRMTPEKKKSIYRFLVVIVAVFVVSVIVVMFYQASLQEALKNKPTSTVNFFSHRDEGTSVFVEISATGAEHAKGLMNRSYLPPDQGMLFIFKDEIVREFWMWNTLIPLDMIFVSADKRIVYIRDNVQPCFTNSCPHYSSLYPAKYVIEVNAGYCKQNQIYEGQYIEINI